jgi:hypothetical protein
MFPPRKASLFFSQSRCLFGAVDCNAAGQGPQAVTAIGANESPGRREQHDLNGFGSAVSLGRHQIRHGADRFSLAKGANDFRRLIALAAEYLASGDGWLRRHPPAGLPESSWRLRTGPPHSINPRKEPPIHRLASKRERYGPAKGIILVCSEMSPGRSAGQYET